eukprot:4647249-Pleurochrysis_carterae.AAC.2
MASSAATKHVIGAQALNKTKKLRIKMHAPADAHRSCARGRWWSFHYRAHCAQAGPDHCGSKHHMHH